MKFIKDSIRELKHVVWPTREETKKYFIIISTFIVLFGLYLFIFNSIFSEFIILLKDVFKS
jgi:preprotein translocase SecE subunit